MGRCRVIGVRVVGAGRLHCLCWSASSPSPGPSRCARPVPGRPGTDPWAVKVVVRNDIDQLRPVAVPCSEPVDMQSAVEQGGDGQQRGHAQNRRDEDRVTARVVERS